LRSASVSNPEQGIDAVVARQVGAVMVMEERFKIAALRERKWRVIEFVYLVMCGAALVALWLFTVPPGTGWAYLAAGVVVLGGCWRAVRNVALAEMFYWDAVAELRRLDDGVRRGTQRNP